MLVQIISLEQTDLHVGYENKLGSLDWYVQGGQTIDSVDGSEESDSSFSGKFGGSVLQQIRSKFMAN